MVGDDSWFSVPLKSYSVLPTTGAGATTGTGAAAASGAIAGPATPAIVEKLSNHTTPGTFPLPHSLIVDIVAVVRSLRLEPTRMNMRIK